MWCSTEKPVYLYDTFERQAKEAIQFFDENVGEQMQKMISTSRGQMNISTDLETAVKNAWMVIEAIPEIMELKIENFGKLNGFAGTANNCTHPGAVGTSGTHLVACLSVGVMH